MTSEPSCGSRKPWRPFVRCVLPERHWEDTGDGKIEAHFGLTSANRWVYWLVRRREMSRAARAGQNSASR